MKIKFRFGITFFLFLVLIAGISIAINDANEETHHSTEEYAVAEDIDKNINGLLTLIYEATLHHEERTHQQVQSSIQSISRLSNEGGKLFCTQEERAIAAEIGKDLANMEGLFSRLETLHETKHDLISNGGSEEEIAKLSAREGVLTNQLMLKTYALSLESAELERTIMDEMITRQEKANTLILRSLLLFALFLGAVMYLTNRDIVKPLSKLADGVIEIGAGNLDHEMDIKTRSEIGEVGTSFNDMTSKLKEYRDGLEELVEERTKELWESEKKYRDLFENALEGVCILDADGNYRDVNDALAKITGYSKNELLKMNVREVVHPDDQETSREFFSQLKNEGFYQGYKGRAVRKNGEVRYIEVNSNAIMENGNFVGSRDIIRDITERKDAEEALESSVKYWRGTFAAITDIVAVISKDHEFISLNKAGLDACGLTEEEILGKKCYEIIHGTDKPIKECPCEKSLKTKKPEFSEYTQDGRHYSLAAWPQFDEKGNVPSYVHTVSDITERKEAEEEIKRVGKTAQTYLDIVGVIMVAIDADQKVTLINSKGREVLGYKEEEIVGKNWFKLFVPKSDRKKTLEGFKMLMAGEVKPVEYFENCIITKSGGERLIAWHNTILKDKDGNIAGTLSSGEDITERKEAADALKESEEKFRSLADNALVGIYRANAKGDILYANEAMAEMLGYKSPEELATKSVFEVYKNQRRRETLIKRLKNEGRVDNFEFEVFTKKGGTKTFLLSTSLEGDVISGVVTDITERKEAEEALGRNWQIQGVINSVLQISMEPITLEEQLERILDVLISIPWIVLEKKGAIFLVEDYPDVLVMKAQRGFHEALASTCDKVPFGRCICGRTAASKEIVFVDRIDERHENTYEGIVPHGHYCVPILSGKHVLGVLNLYVKEGHKWNVFESEFLNAAADAIAGIIERKQANEALKNAYEELKTLDDLKTDIISNVSHELRTPITIVKGALEIALSEEDAQARNKLLEMARKALAKQNMIVGNLIEMSQVQKKKFELNIEEIDLNHVISLTVGEMKHVAEGKEIKIEQEVPDITVMADFERIKDVLLNLLDNAVKFTDRGERIKVSAEVKGDMAEVCVEDTGIGIPEEFHEKVFDRLFQADATTTRKFAGTGMGLALARRIVEAHGGKIRVEGKKKGSRLCFTLPVSKKG